MVIMQIFSASWDYIFYRSFKSVHNFGKIIKMRSIFCLISLSHKKTSDRIASIFWFRFVGPNSFGQKLLFEEGANLQVKFIQWWGKLNCEFYKSNLYQGRIIWNKQINILWVPGTRYTPWLSLRNFKKSSSNSSQLFIVFFYMKKQKLHDWVDSWDSVEKCVRTS